MRVEFKTLSPWARKLLDEADEMAVKITRTQAKTFCRAILGPVNLRDLPSGKGRRVFRLPNSNDALILDYAKRAPRFKPSWVRAQVRRGALRIVLRPALRLELLVTGWF